MLKIGDKVEVTNLKEQRYGEIGTIKDIRSGLFTYPIVVQFGVTWDNYSEEDLELVCEKSIKSRNTEKTNRIQRISKSGRKSIIEWDIRDNKYIEISVKNNPVNLVTLLKIILKETNLYDYVYHRISPYKINKKYDSTKLGHVYTIEFIDIKNNFKIKKEELLITDRTMSIVGELNLFIPDLLEICIDRKILKRNCDGFILAKSLDNVSDYIYLKNKPSVKTLEMNGFIITEEYKKII